MSVLTSAEEAKIQYENFQQLTCLKPGKQSNEYVPGAFAVTAIYENHAERTLDIDEINPANQKDSLLLQLSY
ncbi:hypothetical protein DPMN_079044 [Dreissena polymorpha]|uniref:Uncharacterized protein n=1 Tax=Dreissena polymorpha TaxID=45954 RepID=A0A9D3YRS8_DREPO|nr:hypothetical protein DPMN_079044 [Dreissena polymorpha]